MFFAPWSRSRFKEKSVAGASVFKSQVPEPQKCFGGSAFFWRIKFIKTFLVIFLFLSVVVYDC